MAAMPEAEVVLRQRIYDPDGELARAKQNLWSDAGDIIREVVGTVVTDALAAGAGLSIGLSPTERSLAIETTLMLLERRYSAGLDADWVHALGEEASGFLRMRIPVPEVVAGRSRMTGQIQRRILLVFEGETAVRHAATAQKLADCELEVILWHIGEAGSRRAATFRNEAAQTCNAEIERNVSEIGAHVRMLAEEGASARMLAEGVLTQVQHVGAAAQQSVFAMDEAERATGMLEGSVRDLATRADLLRGAGRSVQEGSATAEAASRALSDEVEAISSILDLVRCIARQTNMLALNASIEAARAGSAGSGFAVVAQEIKLLSGRSTRATDEISSRIGAIQEANLAATAVRATLNSSIEEMAAFVASTHAALADQRRRVGEIATAIGETAGAARAASGAVASIHDGVRSSSERMEALTNALAMLLVRVEKQRLTVQTFIDLLEPDGGGA